jgi:3-carboxy-cis,cis-muconate cycloisomerase
LLSPFHYNRPVTLTLTFADEPIAAALDDASLLAAMARFEAALALASARAGVLPIEDAQVIVRVSDVAHFDAAALARQARNAGTLAIPFVKALTAQVAASSPSAARWVHFGATSQDTIDTALVLCVQPAGRRLLELVARLGDSAAKLTREYAATPMAARTLLQPAAPISFGWKAAVWLSLVADAYAPFAASLEGMRVLQLGGPVGTLAAFGDKAEAVTRLLAEELRLRAVPIAWHGARGGIARLGVEAAILVGAAAKIARDVALLMQAEVAEAFEPGGAGRGGSSSLPHKRNPALSLLALEAAQRAPQLAATLLAELAPEHERGLAQWQSQFFTLRDLLGACGSGLAAMAEALEGLRVDPVAMLANLERTQGLVFSEALANRLSRTLGKPRAHTLVESLCAKAVRETRHLREVFMDNEEARGAVPDDERARLFDYAAQLGDAPRAVARVLACWEAVKAARS